MTTSLFLSGGAAHRTGVQVGDKIVKVQEKYICILISKQDENCRGNDRERSFSFWIQFLVISYYTCTGLCSSRAQVPWATVAWGLLVCPTFHESM